jgi:hypothetical protein
MAVGVAGVVVAVALVLWWYAPYMRGAVAARRDISRGHYEIQVYGPPSPPWVEDSDRLVRERYGVVIKPVAGCCPTPDLADYVDGYNGVSVPRIHARFGKDIFAECAADARAAWKRDHPNE